MSEILELLGTYNDYMLPIIFGIAVVLVATFLIDMSNKRIGFLKYVPGLAAFVGGLMIFMATFPRIYEGSKLNMAALGAILAGCGIMGLCFAGILGLIKPKTKKSKEYYVDYEDY